MCNCRCCSDLFDGCNCQPDGSECPCGPCSLEVQALVEADQRRAHYDALAEAEAIAAAEDVQQEGDRQ